MLASGLVGQHWLVGSRNPATSQLNTVAVHPLHNPRGIGHGLVQKLLERSNKVIATARVPADAQQLQQLAKENSNLTLAALDVSQPDSIAAFAAEVNKHTAHVDVSAAVLSGTPHSADFPPA